MIDRDNKGPSLAGSRPALTFDPNTVGTSSCSRASQWDFVQTSRTWSASAWPERSKRTGSAGRRGSTRQIFTIDGLSTHETETIIQNGILHDPVSQIASSAPLTPEPGCADWIIEVSFRPGVTDNEGRPPAKPSPWPWNSPRSVRKSCPSTPPPSITSTVCRTATPRSAWPTTCWPTICFRPAPSSPKEWQDKPGFPPQAARVTGQAKGTVEIPDLFNMLEPEMEELSRQRTLALSLDEWWTIRGYFGRPGFKMRRRICGLIHNPTDVELECIAQTWSEHCKHKIFNATITYLDEETAEPRSSTACLRPTSRIRPPTSARRSATATSACPSFPTMPAWCVSPTTSSCASRSRPTTVPRPWTPTAAR